MLICSKVNFDGVRQEFAKVDWSRFFVGKGISRKWEAFKSVRVQGIHIPVGGKAGIRTLGCERY